MKPLRLLLCGAATLATASLGSGCTTNLGDFTLLASKNVDLSNFNSQVAEHSAAVSGEDKRPIFCVFGTGNPSLKEALDRAEDQGNAYGLTNARIEIYSWYIPYIYGEVGIKVSGNPLPR